MDYQLLDFTLMYFEDQIFNILINIKFYNTIKHKNKYIHVFNVKFD